MDGAPEPPRRFEEVALRQGLITPEQLEECVRLRDSVLAQGLPCDLEEVLLKKGLLTKTQAAGIHAALGQGNKTAVEGYEILGKLGAGGMGAVYKANQTSMDRLVALKVLLPKYAKDKDGVHRFLREARALAKLNHPNIVSGIDAGFSNGIYYYVMEYVEGEGLDRRIARLGKLPWREAVAILKQVAAALDHAHRNGLVHRDVKPANVILAKDGTAKLMDLGLVRFAGQDGMTLTQTGFIVGTPFYMAPEQARGGETVDIRADLYSLGITLYEMLAGKPPYTGTDPLVVLNRHLNDTVRFAFPDVPPELLAIGHRLTERDRARRYATPEELLEDLDALGRDEALPHARSAVRPRTARVPLATAPRAKSSAPLFIGIGAGVLALIAVAALAVPGRKEVVPSPPVVETVKAPAVPAPTPGKPAVSKADKDAQEAVSLARQYQMRNPGDLEEIAARYAALVDRTAGTSEHENARRLAGDAKDALAEGVEKRKATATEETRVPLQARRYGAALEALDRHARAFRSEAWKTWHAAERAKAEAALKADADRLRESSRSAEAKADFDGAAAPMKELGGFGVPALAAEAAQRIEALEAARKAAAADLARKAESDRTKLAAFLDQADAWAAERAYEKIEPGAPALATEPARQQLKAALVPYRGAQGVLLTALQHLRGQVDKAVRFQTKDGAAVAGRLEAVQDRPLAFLVSGKAHEAGAIATASIVDFCRAARGAADEAAVYFAILDGDAATAEALLKRKPVAIEARYRERLQRLASARKETPPAPVAKKPESPAKEVVIHVAELPKGALYGELAPADDPAAAGGKLALIPQQGDTKDPLENDAQAVFKVTVQAGLPYRCWVRMRVGKAKGVSQANLLYVQFTNAVDKSGKEILTLGTADYLTLRAPPREGWIWLGRDLTDAKSSEPEIRFRTSGEVTVRIAAGVEGVGFDQFALSPGRHFERPPAEAVVPATRP